MNQVNRRIVLSAIACGAAMCAAPTVSNAEPTPAHEVQRTRNIIGRRVTFIARDGARFQGHVVSTSGCFTYVNIDANHKLELYASSWHGFIMDHNRGYTDDDPCHWPLGHVIGCERQTSDEDLSAILRGARICPEDMDILGNDVAVAREAHGARFTKSTKFDRLLMEEDRLTHK